ncbi:MAG: 30S ribosomal protein S6 [Solirubrobacteraceae bacterium]|nr:30S ribosomal protein S6 [Solirubrobacteraceae bacterium]
MATPAPTYDLVLLLDSKVEDDQRAKIRTDVRAMIEAAGTIVRDEQYGTRTLAYEIEKRTDATYELLQFKGPRELLEQLDRTLRITDGVVRFRIVKLREGMPSAPDLRQAAGPVAEPAGEPAAASS